MLGTEELIQIRRHLHQIPELALQETETHAYLMEVIGKMEQDHLEILEPEDLPTAILVRVNGWRPSERLVTAPILTPYRFKRRPAYPTPLPTPG